MRLAETISHPYFCFWRALFFLSFSLFFGHVVQHIEEDREHGPFRLWYVHNTSIAMYGRGRRSRSSEWASERDDESTLARARACQNQSSITAFYIRNGLWWALGIQHYGDVSVNIDRCECLFIAVYMLYGERKVEKKYSVHRWMNGKKKSNKREKGERKKNRCWIETRTTGQSASCIIQHRGTQTLKYHFIIIIINNDRQAESVSKTENGSSCIAWRCPIVFSADKKNAIFHVVRHWLQSCQSNTVDDKNNIRPTIRD